VNTFNNLKVKLSKSELYPKRKVRDEIPAKWLSVGKKYYY